MGGGGLEKIAHSKGDTFFICCLVFLTAIGVALLVPSMSWSFIFSLWVGCSFLVVTLWNQLEIRLVFLGIWCILLAFLRVQSVLPNAADEAHILAFVHTKHATVTGVVVREPDMRIGYTRYTVEAERLTAQKETHAVHGKFQFSIFPYPPYTYGDRLTIHCTLEEPNAFNEFRYDLYLHSQDIFVLCSWPDVTNREEQKGLSFFGTLFAVKNTVAEKIQRIWPEPYAGFMSGLLYGYRGGLGSLDPLFRQTGITHMVAVSGQNIVIVANALLQCSFALRIRRRRALGIVTVGIVCFVLFTGASASVVRAGCMALIAVFSEWLGRGRSVRNILALTAVCMVTLHPFLLFYDPGFILSFLATIGIIYTTPWMKEKISFFPTVFGIQEIMSTTLAAILWTLPYGLYQFGTVSLVAPVVNVLVGPMVPILMGVGAVAVFLGFLFLPAGVVFGFISYVLMRVCIGLVRFFAELPFASISVSFGLPFMCISYIFFVWFFFLKKRYRV